MDRFIGSLLRMSVQPLSSIHIIGMKKDVGFITAQKVAIKIGLQKNCWEQIRGALKFWEGIAADEEKKR